MVSNFQMMKLLGSFYEQQSLHCLEVWHVRLENNVKTFFEI